MKTICPGLYRTIILILIIMFFISNCSIKRNYKYSQVNIVLSIDQVSLIKNLAYQDRIDKKLKSVFSYIKENNTNIDKIDLFLAYFKNVVKDSTMLSYYFKIPNNNTESNFKKICIKDIKLKTKIISEIIKQRFEYIDINDFKIEIINNNIINITVHDFDDPKLIWMLVSNKGNLKYEFVIDDISSIQYLKSLNLSYLKITNKQIDEDLFSLIDCFNFELHGYQSAKIDLNNTIINNGHYYYYYVKESNFSNLVEKLDTLSDYCDMPDSIEILFSRLSKKIDKIIYNIIFKNNPQYDLFILKKTPMLTNRYIKELELTTDLENNQPLIIVTYNDKGTQIFSDITGHNIKKKLAIILDNVVITAPTIQSKISSGTSIISGFSNKEEMTAFKDIVLNDPFPESVNITKFILKKYISEYNHE